MQLQMSIGITTRNLQRLTAPRFLFSLLLLATIAGVTTCYPS